MIDDFTKLANEILKCKTKKEFDVYLESHFFEIEKYFNTLDMEEIDNLKFSMEDFLYDIFDKKLITKQNSKIADAFLLLLAQEFEQANLIGAITIILNYLPEGNIKNRLEASKLYLKVNDISKDYHRNFKKIMQLLDINDENEYLINNIRSIVNFYITAMGHFKRVNNISLSQSFAQLFQENRTKYRLLNDDLVLNTVKSLTIENYHQALVLIKKQIEESRISSSVCLIDTQIVKKEDGIYAQKLYKLSNPTFDEIRHICYQYVKSIGDPQSLYDRLIRGTAIIEDEELLYKYIVSFGAKHKAKLYSSFEVILDNLMGEKFNVIDWGCGQALATMMLLDFAKSRGVKLDIKNIILIEPSKLALSRGLLHIDILKQQNYGIKAINKDIDCIKEEDLAFDNSYKTIQIFSNILDMESFSLDTTFLKKISSSVKNDNLFLCVSPKRDMKSNSRIDLFYNHFNENFNTELISSRDADIDIHTRYEKIFEVKYTKPEEIKTIRETATKNSSLDIYSELESYKRYLMPILDLQGLNETIEKDPEYLIFKIRKVAEVLTSKIYSNYENNSSTVSFNDMIRYLSFDKRLFNKKITSNLHTIRTIGNVNVHEHGQELSSQKLDAHLMLISLLILLKELEEKKELR